LKPHSNHKKNSGRASSQKEIHKGETAKIFVTEIEIKNNKLHSNEILKNAIQ